MGWERSTSLNSTSGNERGERDVVMADDPFFGDEMSASDQLQRTERIGLGCPRSARFAVTRREDDGVGQRTPGATSDQGLVTTRSSALAVSRT